MIKTDILIIGAGPAGSIAAATCLKHGFSPLVIEKSEFPRFVIGESLLPRCMEDLEYAGFLEELEAKKFQAKTGALFNLDGMWCDFDFADQFTKGWSRTWHVPRAEFDMVLTDSLKKRGANIQFNKELKSVEFGDNHQLSIIADKSGNEETIESKFIIDASGFGRVLPRLLDLNKPSTFPPRTAFFTHIKDTDGPPDPSWNKNILYYSYENKLYTWVIPFADGITSVGFVGDEELFDTTGANLDEQFRNMCAAKNDVNERFGDKEFLYPPKKIKGYSVGVKGIHGNGYALTGNATEFLDPIFSSGVTVAAKSGRMAAELACKQLQGENVDWEAEYSEPLMHGINVFKSFVEAWYEGILFDIFFAPNPDPTIKKQICSVLAGYAWDKTNPFVNHPERHLKTLSKVVKMMS